VRPSLMGMICPRPMCYLTALFRPPPAGFAGPYRGLGLPNRGAFGQVRNPTERLPAARGEALVGGAAQNGVISPARVACVATTEFTIPGPVLIITPRNSMAAITA